MDLLVGELQRYEVSVGEFKIPSGLELMCSQLPMDIRTLLHSGRPASFFDGAVAGREGIGLALHVRVTALLRMAREVWKLVSSRVIKARLKWVHWHLRRSNVFFATVFCAYASTTKAPPAVRSQFLEQLQDTLDDIPQGDTLVMLGD